MKILIRTDGASSKECGISSHAWVIYKDDKLIKQEVRRSIKNKPLTSNQEEYMGVLDGLKDVVNMFSFQKADKIFIETDSQLIVEQLLGNYKIKSGNLKSINQELKKEVISINIPILIKHIPRKENNMADNLAKQGLKISDSFLVK